MELRLRNVQYHPDTGAIALLIEHDLGSFFVNTTEQTVGDRWGNAEMLAAAQAGVDERFPGKGFTVVIPEPPAPPEAPALEAPAPEPAP